MFNVNIINTTQKLPEVLQTHKIYKLKREKTDTNQLEYEATYNNMET